MTAGTSRPGSAAAATSASTTPLNSVFPQRWHRPLATAPQLIVGPLARDAVSRRPPSPALDRHPGAQLPAARHSRTERVLSVRLSPEDEAREVARRILADGYHAGVALVPTGDWGTRVIAAFTQELQAGGGALLAQASIDPGLADYSPEITQVLRISDSRARAKRLESVVGAKLSSSRGRAATSSSSSRQAR